MRLFQAKSPYSSLRPPPAKVRVTVRVRLSTLLGGLPCLIGPVFSPEAPEFPGGPGVLGHLPDSFESQPTTRGQSRRAFILGKVSLLPAPPHLCDQLHEVDRRERSAGALELVLGHMACAVTGRLDYDAAFICPYIYTIGGGTALFRRL